MAENKRFLIDTQIFLWWLDDNPKLSDEIKNLLRNPKNEVFLSVISVWEILIKKELKKLKIPSDLNTVIEKCGFDILSIELSHVFGIDKLPFHHKDPFDRMLVSQASEEQMTLISADKKIRKYQISVLHC